MYLSFSFVDAKILLQELSAGVILENTRVGKIPTNRGKFPQRLLRLIPEDRPMSHGPRPIRSGTGCACRRTSVLPEATMASAQLPVSEWLQRIRGEYREMPGLSLNKEQMQKLWGLDAFVCDALVDALVAARVLRRTVGGAYVVHGAGV